jgi:transcription antitermination factor NusG
VALISKIGSHGGPRPNSGGYRPGAGRPTAPLIEMRPRAGDRWYVVRTRVGETMLADREIRLSGFDVFNASIYRPEVRSRRLANGAVRPARPARADLLFVRYVIVRFDASAPDWRRLLSLDGVERVLSAARFRGDAVEMVPIPVPDASIEQLRALLSADGCIYPPGHKGAPLAAGSALVFVDGPFADRAALCEMSDGKRVLMLMRMMGREVPISALQAAVRPV